MQHVRVIYFPWTSDFAFGVPIAYGVQPPLSLFHLKAENSFSYWERDSDKLTSIYEASSGISSYDKVLIQTK